MLVGAGDGAGCDTANRQGTTELLAFIIGTVFTAGDSAYPDGRTSKFANRYDRFSHRHKASTANHVDVS